MHRDTAVTVNALILNLLEAKHQGLGDEFVTTLTSRNGNEFDMLDLSGVSSVSVVEVTHQNNVKLDKPFKVVRLHLKR